MTDRVDERTWQEVAAGYPLEVRAEIAKARNSKARVAQHQQGMRNEAATFKHQVRILHLTYGIPARSLAALFEVSRARIRELLAEAGKKKR